MVYHHRKVKCPSCGKTADRTRTVDSEILKGSPFRVCPNCKKTYFDPEYKEMGIVLYEEKGGELNFWGLIWAILSTVLAVYFLCGVIKEGTGGGLLLPLGVFGLVAILFDVRIIKMIKNRSNSEEFHRKQIDYIEGRTKERTQSLVESMNRLSNKAYLDALRIHGVNVPDYFYERLGEIPTDLSAIAVETVSPTEKFICEACGETSPGWYQTCPNCGAAGKMKKNT